MHRPVYLTEDVSLIWVSLRKKCIHITLSDSFSHSVLWFSLRDVYRYKPMSHSSCRLSTMYGSLVYVLLDRVRKYKRCSFFVRYVNIQHMFNE